MSEDVFDVDGFDEEGDDWPRTLYFGQRWDAPIVDHAMAVPTPVGTACLHCKEPIEAGDRGLMRWFLGADRHAELVPTHMECDMRSIMGDVYHLQGTCLCFGGDKHDDRPYREQSRAVLAYLEARRGRPV